MSGCESWAMTAPSTILDHRVHDRLRVDHHLDRVVGDPEELVGLDDLEALVHQGRGVDGDLGSHRPGRVGERLSHADRGQILSWTAPEGSTRRGEDQSSDVALVAGPQALVEGAVLRIDRDDLGAGGPSRPLHHRCAGDQRLLVGECESTAGLERGKRHRESGEADHPVHDDLRQTSRSRRAPRFRSRARSPTAAAGRARERGRDRRSRPHAAKGAAPAKRACRPIETRRGPPPRSASGHSSITSTAWVPIDPVDPTRLTDTLLAEGTPGTEAPSRSARRPSWDEPVIPLACPRFRRCSAHAPGSRWPGARTTAHRPGRAHRRGQAGDGPCPSGADHA